ncbi:unnamed protein product [Bursaphelenchus okinawaensis]|uniref:F-box domain-containing protein n=1 Tax=Bursaphelenchus okinawaensis TaxID=465554 RepID=A0A811L7H7_9BILA|nr:unnamed protein product [Bursaphelenchus okinawaensis]CAG9119554.1 unnamed protein product [Bursaphelenchus okinawaensis]
MFELYGHIPSIQKTIIKYLKMDDLCSLCMVNKQYYATAALDFKTLCYSNLVYRIAGETWAKAFQQAQQRISKVHSNVAWCKDIVYCPYSGRLAYVLCNNQVMLTHIDLASPQCEVIHFCVDSEDAIDNIQLINDGRRIIVDTLTHHIVYNIKEKQVVATQEFCYPTKQMTFYRNPQLQHGRNTVILDSDDKLLDLYTMKVFDLVFVLNHNIVDVDPTTGRRYFLYTHDANFMVLDTTISQWQKLCDVRKRDNVFVVQNPAFAIIERQNSIEIYNLRTAEPVFQCEKDNDDCVDFVPFSKCCFCIMTDSGNDNYISYKKDIDTWKASVLQKDKDYDEIEGVTDRYKPCSSLRYSCLETSIPICYIDWTKKNPIRIPYSATTKTYGALDLLVPKIQEEFAENDKIDVMTVFMDKIKKL